MPDPEVDLSDLLPKVPLEELVMRAALGLPGRPPIEVGLGRDRFAEPRGRPMGNRQLALQRALGGVSFPVEPPELVQQAQRWLQSFPDLVDQLRALPERSYGGELEVLRELELGARRASPEPPSAGGGNDAGSSENQKVPVEPS
jgi:hypothetical protein